MNNPKASACLILFFGDYSFHLSIYVGLDKIIKMDAGKEEDEQ